jgi:hypothetical protein
MSYKFSPYVINNVEYLNKLAKTKSIKKRQSLLLTATSEQILSIVEICANILKSNFTLTSKQRRRLANYADNYRSIARSRTERTARNRIQQGGQLAISALLAPVLSVIAQTLLDKVLHK